MLWEIWHLTVRWLWCVSSPLKGIPRQSLSRLQIWPAPGCLLFSSLCKIFHVWQDLTFPHCWLILNLYLTRQRGTISRKWPASASKPNWVGRVVLGLSCLLHGFADFDNSTVMVWPGQFSCRQQLKVVGRSLNCASIKSESCHCAWFRVNDKNSTERYNYNYTVFITDTGNIELVDLCARAQDNC